MQNFHIKLIEDKTFGCFTACIPNVPAYGEGNTKDEAIHDLKAGLKLYFEEYGSVGV